MTVRRDFDIVLDANAAERQEPLDRGSIEARLVLREQHAQQRRNEVEPGLDRGDDAGLQRARQAQVRVRPRRLALLAGLVREMAARVVHLKTEQVTEAVRQEAVRDAGRDGLVGAARHELVLDQQRGDLPVRECVQHDEVDARLHFRADALLQRVHRRDQRREVVARGSRVRARDVGGIALELGAGIDQQRARDGRRLGAHALVVQRRAVLVQSDDVAVRQLRLALPTGREISLVQLQLRRARLERRRDGDVPAHGHRLRAAHAEQLVGRLDGARVVEVAQEACVVDGRLSLGAAAASGAFGYIIKPVSYESLRAQIAIAVRRFEEMEQVRRENAELAHSLETRKLVEKAKGVLMKTLRLDEQAAHRRLQLEAQKRRITMADAAKRVIDTDKRN